MIAEVTMYRVLCDGCGVRVEGLDYSAWDDPTDAEQEAEDENWLRTDRREHYCPDCQVYDAATDTYRPKPAEPEEEPKP